MTTTTYKGYTIKTVAVSHYIYRASSRVAGNSGFNNIKCDGYAQSMAAAKRWINEDIKQRLLENNRYYA